MGGPEFAVGWVPVGATHAWHMQCGALLSKARRACSLHACEVGGVLSGMGSVGRVGPEAAMPSGRNVITE